MNNSSTKLYNVLMGNPTNGYNSVGRSAGLQNIKQNSTSSDNPNFFQKKWNSLENAFGTTLAAPVSAINDVIENRKTDEMLERHKTGLEDTVKEYGYEDQNAFWDAKKAAEQEIYKKYGYDIDDYRKKRADIWSPDTADSEAVKNLEAQREQVIANMSQEDADKIRQFNNIENEIRGQTAANAKEATDKAKSYEDYRKNDYISKKINQDRGKFLGSSINTLSTMFDIMAPGAGMAANAVQGGLEGVADELEQNGFEDFSWERAGQNAAIGAASGAATGAFNTKLNNFMGKRGGNLFKGNNKLTAGLNKLGSETKLGRAGSTIATGATRGAASGAIGGGVGGGTEEIRCLPEENEH